MTCVRSNMGPPPSAGDSHGVFLMSLWFYNQYSQVLFDAL